MTAFIRGELHQRVRDGFSILSPAADAVRLFGDNLKLFYIEAVPQEHRRPRLILNLSVQPDEGTSSANETTVKESAPRYMKFGRAFPRILQEIWKVDPFQGPIRVSNLDVTDAYHRGTFRPAQVGSYAYIFPASIKENCLIICIDLVLPMGWVDSPKYFCT